MLKKEQSRNMKSTMVDSFNHCAPVQKPTQKIFLHNISLPTRRGDLKQKSIIRNVWPSKIFDAERDEPKETKIRRTDEQIESKVDTQRELNASLQHCSNCTLPPLWFTEYMESVRTANIHTRILISARIFPGFAIYLHKMIVIYYSFISCIPI